MSVGVPVRDAHFRKLQHNLQEADAPKPFMLGRSRAIAWPSSARFCGQPFCGFSAFQDLISSS